LLSIVHILDRIFAVTPLEVQAAVLFWWHGILSFYLETTLSSHGRLGYGTGNYEQLVHGSTISSTLRSAFGYVCPRNDATIDKS